MSEFVPDRYRTRYIYALAALISSFAAAGSGWLLAKTLVGQAPSREFLAPLALASGAWAFVFWPRRPSRRTALRMSLTGVAIAGLAGYTAAFVFMPKRVLSRLTSLRGTDDIFQVEPSPGIGLWLDAASDAFFVFLLGSAYSLLVPFFLAGWLSALFRTPRAALETEP